MKLYLITQTENASYDAYRGAVVAAESVADAKMIHPGGKGKPLNDDPEATWVVDPALVKVLELGSAGKGVKRGVILADFDGERPIPTKPGKPKPVDQLFS